MKIYAKFLFLFAFLLLFSLTSIAQPGGRFQPHHSFENILGTDTIVNETFLSQFFNKKQWIIRNKTKDTLEIVEVKKSKLHGEQQLFYQNGDVKTIAHYKKGLLNGKVEYFVQNSQQLIRVEHYKALPKEEISVLHGKVEHYIHGKGIKEEFNYKNGEKEGAYVIYHPNEKVKVEGQFENGLDVGRKLTYYRNGDLLQDENFIIIDNPEYIAAIDQQKEKYGKVKHEEIKYILETISVLDGSVKYYRNGHLLTDYTYIKGKKESWCKEYHYNSSTLKYKSEYKENKRHGAFNDYFSNGEIRSKGIFYKTIKVDGQIYNNVYDGEIVYYREKKSNKGPTKVFKNRIENWKDFKKNGVSEYYSYHNGTLTKRIHFKDNIKTGLEERFNPEGVKNYEGHFEIVEIGGKKVSQQTGIEKSWKEGQLRYTTEWKDGEKNGVSKMYYENGNLDKIMHFADGNLNGVYQTFYENRQIKEDYTYEYSPKIKRKHYIGWNKTYDKYGNLTRVFHAQKDGKNSIGLNFENGKLKELGITDALKITLTSDKKIKNIYWMNSSLPRFGYDMFTNQQLRRVHFNNITTNLTSNGQLIQAYSATGQNIKDLEIDKIAQKVVDQYNPEWNNEELITEGFKDGKYQWKYADGSPFFKIEFKDSLPQGTWIHYNPIIDDTLFKREYEKGLPVGKWIEKTMDGNIISRKSYFPNHQVKESYRYRNEGILKEHKNYDSLGKETYHADYFDNGQLKNERIPSTKSYINLSGNGDTTSYRQLFTKGDSIQVERRFYENNILQLERRNNLTTGLGKVKTFHKNGQLHTLHEMKNKLTDGIYKKFDEDGKLLILGHFKAKKRHGQWVDYSVNGEPEVSQFENGKIVINPTIEDETTCKCYDTTLVNSKIGFAPSLKHFVDYKSIQSFLPTSIIPIDDWNYDNIFYVNLRTDNNRSAGFTGLKLLLYKPFSFHYPAVDYLKFNLNPCQTEGYISNIEGTFRYSLDGTETMNAQLDTKRIAISLEKNPLVDAKNKAPFTACFDTERMNFNQDGIKDIRFSKEDNTSYPLGIINNLMEIEIQKAELDIRPSNGKFSNLPLLSKEVEQFYGFDISEATLTFDYVIENDSIPINATADRVVAGANYVAGRVKVKGKSIKENEFTPMGNKESIDLEKFQRFLEQKEFYRVKVEMNEGALEIEFYTQK